jgi:hypothetical protein
MRYFKNTNNEIYAITADQEFLIRTDWAEITEAEVAVLTAPTPEQIKANRIFELKQLLKDSDYKVLPDYDKPDEAIKEQRQAWRDEIRSLES